MSSSKSFQPDITSADMLRLMIWPNTHTCLQCEKTFNREDNLRRHMTTDHIKRAKIQPLSFNLGDTGAFTTQQREESAGPYQCDLCPCGFMTAFNMSLHK